MKVCLVAHGYPPELVGGTEASVQSLARALAARGEDVLVVAGSMRHEDGFRTSESVDDGGAGAPVRVVRIHRDDLYFEHWQKSASVRVAQAFAELLRRERPDVVHVHHWIRLTRDLVHVAASEGVPAVVSLHDLWASCLVTFRVPPGTNELCEAPLGPSPCLQCVANVPPRTPWVQAEAQFLAVAERRADLLRELELARAVLVPTEVHGAALERYLGVAPGGLGARVVPHGRDLALRRREPPAGPGLVLGAWGHVQPLKGQDLVVDALRRLASPERVALHVAGGAPDAGFLERLRAKASGLNVTFHGAFRAEELDRHPVTLVHAMVSGTRAHESWGLVLDEAVALGLPMIVPRTGAFAERLREGRGALFYEPRDAASLAAVLERILDDRSLLEGVRAALPAVADFVPTSGGHAASMAEVYAEVIAAGPPDRPDASWWSASMRQAAEREWDESLKRRSAEELGFA